MLSPDLEKELLCLCARTYVNQKAGRQIDILLHEPINWDRLIRLARVHWVIQLIYWNLKKTNPDLVPQAALEALSRDFHTNVQGNLLLTAEWRAVLNVLHNNGVIALSLKGPILAQHVYGGIALREFSDIDIMVAEKDFLRLRDLLVTEGYEPVAQPNIVRDRLLLTSGTELVLVNSAQTCSVDIHWALWPKAFFPRPTFDDLIHNASVCSVLDTQTHCLSPEDLLLYVCVHGAKHVWQYFQGVCDVAEVIRANPQLDWMCLWKKAQAFQAERTLFLGLLLANHLMEAPLPARLLKRVTADKLVCRMAVEIEAKMFKEPIKHPEDLDKTRIGLRLQKRWRDKIRALIRSLLVPTAADYDALPLSDRLSQFYYILRPARLLTHFGRQLMRSLR